MLLSLFLHDLLTAIHAAVADVDTPRSCQQLLDLVLRLVTERTPERCHRCFSVPHAIQLLSFENNVLPFLLVKPRRTRRCSIRGGMLKNRTSRFRERDHVPRSTVRSSTRQVGPRNIISAGYLFAKGNEPRYAFRSTHGPVPRAHGKCAGAPLARAHPGCRFLLPQRVVVVAGLVAGRRREAR